MKNSICCFTVASVVFLAARSATATVSYTYENDGKTLVATVNDADTDLTTSTEDQERFTEGLTSFVKRGGKALRVYVGAANSYTGDIIIEGGYLSFYGNAIGINAAQGKVQLYKGALVQIGTSPVTVAKDIEFSILNSDNPEWNGRSLEVWNGRSASISGKVTIGNRNALAAIYGGGTLDFAGGIEETPENNEYGYLFVEANGGSTVTFAQKPLKLKRPLYFKTSNSVINNPDKFRDESGYVGHYVFSAPSNTMSSLGHANLSSDSRLKLCDVKTTADWAFDNSGMTVFFGNDAKWDLCGTEQRVGQLDVKVETGNPPVITNSLETPATLHLAMMYGPNNTTSNIRLGGNMSVDFCGDIYTTSIAYPMTASGDLTVEGDGPSGKSTLAFTENGSWVNATNITIKGVGKMTIENPNALNPKAKINLASTAALEIASGVTVNVAGLTVGGVERAPGKYTFGSGTLVIPGPMGMRISIR